MKRHLFYALLAIAYVLSSTDVQACSKKVVVQQGMDLEKVFASSNMQYIIEQNIDLGWRTIIIGEESTLVFRKEYVS